MILSDTGPMVALNDPGDSYRDAVVRAYARLGREQLAVPAPVIVEAAYFLNRDAGPIIEANFLRQVATGAIRIIEAALADYARAAALVQQYADFPLGTVDALVIAIAERLDITTIFTLDRRHFGTVRPRHVDAFTLVP